MSFMKDGPIISENSSSSDEENELITTTRLGYTFHRTFSINRQSLSSIIDIAHNLGESDKLGTSFQKNMLRELTTLGSIYIDSMPRYAMGSGLLNLNYELTDFGRAVYKNDTLLEFRETQWLMHYFLCGPKGPGPKFWHEIVKSRFITGNEFTTNELAEQIALSYYQSEGKKLADRSARTTATIFLGTYMKPEGLANLGLLENYEGERYRVLQPDTPSSKVIGLALLDFWASNFNGQATIKLDDIIGQESLANLFVMGSGEMNSKLRELQKEGFVQIYRIAPPYQIALLRDDITFLYERLYEN